MRAVKISAPNHCSSREKSELTRQACGAGEMQLCNAARPTHIKEN
jgi:hypothetical protein